MSDQLSDLRVSRIDNRDQIINLIDHAISKLESYLGEWPGPYDPLNGNVYIRWERRAFIWIGVVQGMLNAYRSVGVLPPEHALSLESRAKAAISLTTARAVMGNR